MIWRSIAFFALISIVLGCAEQRENTRSVSPKATQAAPEQLSTEVSPDTLRREWQNPDLVISLLGDISGETVLDIGAGSGYFTFKLAVEAEKVIALEVDPNALEYINEQKVVLGNWTKNIEARLTPPDVPNLLGNEVDKVLIVNTYSLLPSRTQYLLRLLDGMKNGALLVIVDFKLGEIPVGPSDEFKVSPRTVRKELRAAGFDEIKIDIDELSYQFIVTAKKK